MIKAMKKQRYTNELKLEAIRRVLEEDQRVADVVNDLGIRHRDNVYEWIKKYKKNGAAAFDRSIGKSVKNDEPTSTDEKIRHLEMEVDILKKYLEILNKGEHKINTK